MLVLTRKPGQKVVLGGNITVTVVEVRGSQVRLAFEAPDHVHILRGELVVPAEDLGADQEPHDADLEAKPAEWRGTPHRPVLPRRQAYRRLARLACSR
jgi:carbon storage regulator